MKLPDNYFRELSMADIVSKVSTITLAEISRLSTDELIRIGWLNNPVIEILYSLTSAGVWIARTDTNGRVAGQYDASISGNISSLMYLGLPANVSGGTSGLTYSRRKIAVVEFSLVGGSKNNQELVPAISGYYGVFQIRSIMSDTTINPATFTFQDEDDNALTGCIQGVLETTVTANVINTDAEGVTLYKGTDNKALEVDVSGGAGAEVISIEIEYWYET